MPSLIRSTRRSSTVGRVLSGALDQAFPATCAGCGREGPSLCRRCRAALDVRLSLPPGTTIGLPSEVPAPLLQLEWCAPFTGVVRRALHGLKYGGERRLAAPLGEAIAARWAVAGRGADLVVPVPVHPERARERGYDQAVLLAQVAARALGLPAERLLVRERATRPQYALGRRARAENVRGAFRVGDAGRTRLVAGCRILLVDDVVTTGATLAACAEALLAAGAIGVAGAAVARER